MRESPINIFGIVVERETDILAIAAFLLSAGAVIFQVISFIRGSEVEVFASDYITLFENRCFISPGLEITGRLSYVNTGGAGYNAVVKKEFVSFEINKKRKIFESIKYVNSFNNNFDHQTDIDCKKIDGVQIPRLTIKPLHDAKPEPIIAGSAISHEIWFEALPVRSDPENAVCATMKNCVMMETFIEMLKNLKGANVKEYRFDYEAEIVGGQLVKDHCFIDVSEALIDQLERARWASPSCYENSRKIRRSRRVRNVR